MKYVSYLNFGCLEIFYNLLESAKLQGISKDDFYIACLDKKAHNELLSNGYDNVIFWESIAESMVSYQQHSFNSNSTFRQISLVKWPIVKHFFDKLVSGNNETMCFLDTDTVILNNPNFDNYPKDHCYMQMLYQQPIGQEEYVEYSRQELCGGLLVFNDTEFANQMLQYLSGTDEDDQIALNEYCKLCDPRHHLRVLCGRYYPVPKAYMIMKKHNIQNNHMHIFHAAGIRGIENKINFMKKNDMWFL